MPDAIKENSLELFNPERILCQYRAESKIVVLKRLASLLRSSPFVNLSEHDIINGLVHREQLGSTLIDPQSSVAVPHILLNGIEHSSGALIILSNHLTFDDEKRKVNILLGLALPRTLCGSRLPLIDEIRSMFADSEFCADLLKCKAVHEVMDLLHSHYRTEQKPIAV